LNDGRSARAKAGVTDARCRRNPPQVIPSLEPQKLAHEDKGQYVRPYIPDHAWAPLHKFPATNAFDWCGEWSSWSEDEHWAREHGQKVKAVT
jgi:hypothetical protein